MHRVMKIPSNHPPQFGELRLHALLFRIVGGIEEMQANCYPPFWASLA